MSKRNIQKMTVDELRAVKRWKGDTFKTGTKDELRCTGIVVVPSRGLHDSGYRLLSFVACNFDRPVALVSGCSDVVHLDGIGGYGLFDGSLPTAMTVKSWSIDFLGRSGLPRIFCGRDWEFLIEPACSTSSFSLHAVRVGTRFSGGLYGPKLSPSPVSPVEPPRDVVGADRIDTTRAIIAQLRAEAERLWNAKQVAGDSISTKSWGYSDAVRFLEEGLARDLERAAPSDVVRKAREEFLKSSREAEEMSVESDAGGMNGPEEVAALREARKERRRTYFAMRNAESRAALPATDDAGNGAGK